MTHIDFSKPVLVTGATGYVAGWLVKRLLDEGLVVHAAVREPENMEKTKHLRKLSDQSKGTIKFFKANLLDEGSYADAMKGCALVYHTASPFTTVVDNPRKDLVEPAVNGTANVLKEANRTDSVRRVVVTSSCAAIYTDTIECSETPNGFLTEDIWNKTASLDYQPYSYSKTLAEKMAWDIYKAQNKWDLVVVNPSLVMGPALNAGNVTSESYSILKQFGNGTMKFGAPNIGIGIVDVRDVAEAHYRAGFRPEAHGRYITSGYNTDILEMSSKLIPKYGADYPIPKKALPKWLLLLVGPFINKALDRRYIRNNVNVEFRADNSKIRTELGMQFRDMKETMEDSFQVLIDAKLIGKK